MKLAGPQVATLVQALILMGDWCVLATVKRNQTALPHRTAILFPSPSHLGTARQ